MYETTDPTRIPRVLDALQRAWEGQPDLTLTALMGVLAIRGIGWGASDSELVEALAELEREHPSLLDAHPAGHLLIETTAPALRVTLAGDVAVVRDARDASAMPGVWSFSSLRPTGPGRPLVVRDAEEIEHRLGVVTLVSRLDGADVPELAGLERSDLGGFRWVVQFSGGDRAVLGPRLRVWERHRRDVGSRSLAWERIEVCRPGEVMRLAPAGGGMPLELGRVERVVLVEAG